jgi:D-3-phosphoglycerate dehydrogenase
VNPVVFIPETIAECGIALLQPSCEIVSHGMDNADAAIVRLFEITAEQLASCDRLKVIAKHGVGVDNIDVAAATARKVPVVYTPTANANGVAEHALTLMLSLARHVFPSSQALREGRFKDRAQFQGVELAGKTLGVLGLGRIGRRVAEMARNGLAMNVLAYDPFVKESDFALAPSLDAVLRAADFLTLHLPLTEETRHLLNAERLRILKPGCRIINTSRGAVIDESAMVEALQGGQVSGAALDVFEDEPLPADHPLCRAPNTLLTPHISSSTTESLERMACDAAQGVLDVLQGRQPAHVVNPEVLP